MDQVKVVLAHIARQRFWYSLGLAALLSIFVFGGSSKLLAETDRLEKGLEASYKEVDDYKRKQSQPNQEWTKVIVDRKAQVVEKAGSALERLYLEQEKFTTWPAQGGLQERFGQRPFGASLDDDQGRMLGIYRATYEDSGLVTRVYYSLNPLDRANDKLIGVIEAPADPLKFLGAVQWGAANARNGDPSSTEAWQAQEQLWLQGAVIRSIRKANGEAEEKHKGNAGEAWLHAPIKRVDAIRIGFDALDQRALAKKQVLEPYKQEEAAGPNQQKPVSQVPTAARYLEKTSEYRTVPVGVDLVVEQDRIPYVLGELSNADFHYILTDVRMSRPKEKLEVPDLLESAGLVFAGRGADNPLYNCWTLEVKGVMRLYEMPAALKEKRGMGAKPAEPAAKK
jgi:hypothetical protein